MISDDFTASRRLFDAADAFLAAAESEDCSAAFAPICVDDPEFEGELPAGMFTRAELIEAVSMLIRMGIIDLQEHCR